MEGNLEILLEFPSNKFFKNAAFGLLIYSWHKYISLSEE